MAGSSGTEEMLASIETLTRNVKNLKRQLRNHTQAIEWTDTRFSWPASMGLQVPIYDQSAGNCWTYAFATGHQYHNAIRGLGKRKLRPETLQKHVKKRYQSHDGGLRYIGHVKEYLVQHDYVQDVKVFDKDEGANLEKYMEELLFVSPVVVKIPMLRSWRNYEGVVSCFAIFNIRIPIIRSICSGFVCMLFAGDLQTLSFGN